ncbi:hypothetical protein GCM10022259_32370 [Aquimarina mytili]
MNFNKQNNNFANPKFTLKLKRILPILLYKFVTFSCNKNFNKIMAPSFTPIILRTFNNFVDLYPIHINSKSLDLKLELKY